MAGRAAGTMGLSDLAVLDDEGLRFDGERAVLPLDRETQLRLDMQQLAYEQMQRGEMMQEGAHTGEAESESEGGGMTDGEADA
jgi:hypothetical protein